MSDGKGSGHAADKKRTKVKGKSFCQFVVNLWYSLPAQLVHASPVNDFKNKVNAHWSNQEMVHNYPVEISGTVSGSIVHCKTIHLCHSDGAGSRRSPELSFFAFRRTASFIDVP